MSFHHWSVQINVEGREQPSRADVQKAIERALQGLEVGRGIKISSVKVEFEAEAR
jgi:hypothetical protein